MYNNQVEIKVQHLEEWNYHESGCALIGGETLEIYKDGDFLTYMPLYLFIYLYIMQMHNYFF